MVERFFLDGIDRLGRHSLIYERHERAALVFPHAAKAATSRRDEAALMAQVTPDAVSVYGLPEHGFLHFRSPYADEFNV
jgi:hypothetical protein